MRGYANSSPNVSFSFCKAGFRLLIAWYCWGLLVMRVTSVGHGDVAVMELLAHVGFYTPGDLFHVEFHLIVVHQYFKPGIFL